MSRLLNSVKWNLFGQIQFFIFKFTIGIITARLLSPEEFGLVGIVLIFSEFAQIFIDGGFNASLIQKKKVEQRDYDAIFTFNILIGILCAILLFITSYKIADFFDDDRLVSITKALTLVFFLNSLTVVHRAKLTKEQNFKKQTIVQGISTLVSGIVGIVLAILGFSYWAIVIKQVVDAFVSSVLYLTTVKLKVRIGFQRDVLESHWIFSKNIFLSQIISVASNKVDQIIVGKLFSKIEFGNFVQGKSYANLPLGVYQGAVSKSLFPALVKIQKNNQLLENYFLPKYNLVTILICGLLIFFSITSNTITNLLLGIKWKESAIFFGAFLLLSVFSVLSGMKYSLLTSQGFSRVALYQNVLMGPFRLIAVILLSLYYIEFTPMTLVYVSFVTGLISYVYVSYQINFHLHFDKIKCYFSNYKELIAIVISSIITRFFLDNTSYYLSSFLQLLLGFVIYCILIVAVILALKANSIYDLKKLCLKFLNNGNFSSIKKQTI